MLCQKRLRQDAEGIGMALALLASLALAPLAALAQSCNGPVTLPRGETAANPGEKFRLIAEQCDVLAEPLRVRRAGQLDLYDRSPVTIRMSPAEAAPGESPPAPRQPRSSLPPASREETRVMVLAPAVTAAARAYAIDPLLMHAIAHVESRHNVQAVSPAGARGVMQLTPATARRFGVTDPEHRLLDADTNLQASAALLQSLLRRYGDDPRLVLAAYNAGEGAVEKFGRNVPPYPETQGYVRDVMAAYRRLAAEFEITADGDIVARRRP